MTLKSIVRCCTYPFFAVFSTKFYFHVYSNMRGVGITYLFLLALAVSFPANFKVMQSIEYFGKLHLDTVISQLPPSYIDKSGILHSNDDSYTKEPLVVKNQDGHAVLAYNLTGQDIPHYPNGLPITFTEHSLIIQTQKGTFSVPWSTFYGDQGGVFEPSQVASTFRDITSTSFISAWFVLAFWMFGILSFVVLVSTCVIKVFYPKVLNVNYDFRQALRLSAFGSTLVALLLLLQFYIAFDLPFFAMCIVPLGYVAIFSYSLRVMLVVVPNNSRKDNQNQDGKEQGPVNQEQHFVDEKGERYSGPELDKSEDPYKINKHTHDDVPIFEENEDYKSKSDDEDKVKKSDNGKDSSFTP